MDVFGFQDYREILRIELARRIKQNPRYSQGAFARDLVLTPSRLSEILHGKQGVSTKVATQIAKNLRFSESERSYFLDLVESQHGRSRLLREAAKLRLHRYRRAPFAEKLGDDEFRLISDWYHAAMLELLRLPQHSTDPHWIAAALRISPEEAHDGIQRLLRLGLIEETAEGQIRLSDVNQRFTGSMHSESFQKFSRQILLKAIDAVNETRADASYGYMLGVSQSRLSQLLAILKESCDRLAETIDQDQGEKDVVYCMALQFFPIAVPPPRDLH